MERDFYDLDIEEEQTVEQIEKAAPPQVVEKETRFPIAIGTVELITFLGFDLINKIARLTDSEVVKSIAMFDNQEDVKDYILSSKLSLGSLQNDCRTTINCGVTIVSDNIGIEEADAINKDKPEFLQKDRKFVNYLIANHNMIKARNLAYVTAMGHLDNNISYVRIPPKGIMMYKINTALKRVFMYKEDSMGTTIIPTFRAPKMPEREAIPTACGVNGNVTILAYYMQFKFMEKFVGMYSKFPIMAVEGKMFPPEPNSLKVHCREVVNFLLTTKDIDKFSDQWAKIVARSFNYDEPMDPSRLIAYLANFLGCSAFHGPLHDVATWFLGDKMSLISDHIKQYSDLTIDYIKPLPGNKLNNVILSNAVPALIDSYVESEFKIKALIFPWATVATGFSKTYSLFFQGYPALSIFFLLGRSINIAMAVVEDGQDIASGDVMRLWGKINAYIIACFYDQWFWETKCNIVRVTYADKKIKLTPYQNPPPINRIYRTEKSEVRVARMMPQSFDASASMDNAKVLKGAAYVIPPPRKAIPIVHAHAAPVEEVMEDRWASAQSPTYSPSTSEPQAFAGPPQGHTRLEKLFTLVQGTPSFYDNVYRVLTRTLVGKPHTQCVMPTEDGGYNFFMIENVGFVSFSEYSFPVAAVIDQLHCPYLVRNQMNNGLLFANPDGRQFEFV